MKGKLGSCAVIDCACSPLKKEAYKSLCYICYDRWLDRGKPHTILFYRQLRWGEFKIPATAVPGGFFQWRCRHCWKAVALARVAIPPKAEVVCCKKTWVLLSEINS